MYESKSATVSWVTYPSSGALKLNFSTLTWRSSDDSTGVTGFKKAGYTSSLRIQSSGEAAHLRLQTADPVWTQVAKARGTSLSKVFKVIDRFSEDIDLSLSRRDLGFAGARDPENAS